MTTQANALFATKSSSRGQRVRRDWLIALALVLLAALPRLYRLDLAEFKLDEANHYRMAYELLRGGWRWTGSTASVGFPKPPLFVYTLALPLAVTCDPRVVTGFLGVLAALAAGGFYLALQPRMGRKAAAGATLLFAFNPQAVLHARKLFTADLLPPLSALFFWASLNLIAAPSRRVGRAAIWAAFSFALLLLTTFSPLILAPVLAFAFWRRRSDLTPRAWWGALAALGLPFVPYLIAVRSDIVSLLTALFTNAQGETSAAASTFSAPPLIRWMLNLLWGTSYLPGWLGWMVGLFLAGVTLAGAAGLIWAAWRQGADWARVILLWVGLCPLLMLGLSFVTPVQMQAHYLVVLYPVLFALPGAAIAWAERRSSLWGRAALLLLMGVAVWSFAFWDDTLEDVARGVEGYGTPLGYWRRAAKQARDFAAEHDAEVLAYVPGDQPWDEQAAIFDALLCDTPHRVVNGHTTVVLPSHPAVFLVASDVESSLALVSPCTRGLDTRLAASPFGGAYSYRLWTPQSSIQACLDLTPAEGVWASGARLLGYAIEGSPEPGATLHVTLAWEATRGPVAADIHWFNHLVATDGQRWGQFDGAPWPGERWRGGDRVLWRFDLPIADDAPPPPYALRVGQYTYPDFEGIPVVDDAGAPRADAVEIPLPAP